MEIDRDERTTAIGLFHFAHSYASSAIMLTQHPTRATHRDAPVRYLFAHAAELYLKAFCRMRGVTVTELRDRSLGHDLQALLERATALGLDYDTELHSHLLAMNDAIEDRYIVTGCRCVLEADAMRVVCARLNDQIGPLIYQAEGLSRSAPSL
jgi:hypothetical protein